MTSPITPGAVSMASVPIAFMTDWLAAYGDEGAHVDAFFHPDEQAWCRDHRFPEERWAARLAAKKAVQRIQPVRALDVVVGRTGFGAPTLTVRGPEGPVEWLISISHERSQGPGDPGVAVALVVSPIR